MMKLGVSKEVIRFVKKADRLLNEVEHRVVQGKLQFSLDNKYSKKDFWNIFKLLSFTFKKGEQKKGEQKIYFSDVFEAKAYYKCGCEVEGFSSHFEEDCLWSYDHAIYLVNKCMCEIYTEGGEISFGIDLVNFTASMKVKYSEQCEDCLEASRYVLQLKETMRPDSLLQQAIYSHGLATGFGMNEVSAEKAEENLKILLNLVGSDKEICCSWKNQQIGGFGLFIKGEVTIASNRDLWSYVGRSGQREFNSDEYEDYIISRRDEVDFSVWDHTEFFVKPKELIAFWAKDWFVRDVPGGRELVEKLQDWGYKVYITRCRHR